LRPGPLITEKKYTATKVTITKTKLRAMVFSTRRISRDDLTRVDADPELECCPVVAL